MSLHIMFIFFHVIISPTLRSYQTHLCLPLNASHIDQTQPTHPPAVSPQSIASCIVNGSWGSRRRERRGLEYHDTCTGVLRQPTAKPPPTNNASNNVPEYDFDFTAYGGMDLPNSCTIDGRRSVRWRDVRFLSLFYQ